MKIIEAKSRKRPFKTQKTHARLRHDYAVWHSDHLHHVNAMTSHKLPFENKSKFDSAKIIDVAIDRSINYPAIEGKNGNHVVTFDMGYLTGFDAKANRRTSAVTVVLKPSGEVITAHPGTSWSSDQSEA